MELFDFQRKDCLKLYRAGCGLDANEMGTGKTVEAIEVDKGWAKEKNNPEKLPTLVIAPINTFDGWIDRYTDLDPDADVVVVERTPAGREAFVQAIVKRRGDVFLCNYESARILQEKNAKFRELRFNTVILDECHRIANRKSQTTKAVQYIGKRARYRLALSGTASGDKPENLWTILNWLYPRVFTSYWNFRRRYCLEDTETKYVKGKDGAVREVSYRKIVGANPDTLPELHRLIQPFYVRHLKRDPCCPDHPHGVMDQLPAKTYDKIWVDLNPTQRRIYEQMRKEMVAWVGEHEDSPLVASVVVAQLVRLSQIALATPEIETWKELFTNPSTGRVHEVTKSKVKLTLPSSKLEVLLEKVKDNPKKKFVVFSSSKQICYLAQQYMKEHGIGTFVLSGDTPTGQREGMVRRFVEAEPEDCQLFISVIKAGGEGVDGLQHATDTAIFLDRDPWTIKNQQAEDRLHREGQKDTVQIIDILARHTNDVGNLERDFTKWQAIKYFLGDHFNNVEYVRSAA
jgi:SNF2 family DNA or RNA helicase